MLLAAFGDDDPGTAEKRRLMPDMLAMAAGQISHPVAKFILMIADDELVHALPALLAYDHLYVVTASQTAVPGVRRQARTPIAFPGRYRNSRERRPGGPDGGTRRGSFCNHADR